MNETYKTHISKDNKWKTIENIPFILNKHTKGRSINQVSTIEIKKKNTKNKLQNVSNEGEVKYLWFIYSDYVMFCDCVKKALLKKKIMNREREPLKLTIQIIS